MLFWISSAGPNHFEYKKLDHPKVCMWYTCITMRRVVALLQSLQSSRHKIMNSLCCIFVRTRASTARPCTCFRISSAHRCHQSFWHEIFSQKIERKWVSAVNITYHVQGIFRYLQGMVFPAWGCCNEARCVNYGQIWAILVLNLQHDFLRPKLAHFLL